MSAAALVTGAGRGTGLAIAQRLAREGLAVSCLNRRPGGPEALAIEVCDLADPTSVREACDKVLARTGKRLEVCVINAAQRILRPVSTMEDEDWEAQVAVNLSSAFRVVQRVLPALKAARGTLVFMGSHAADHYFEGGAAYCATKAALRAFAEVVALETRDFGVRSIVVSPGAIRNRADDDSVHKIAPDDVADLVWRLVQAGDSLIVGEVEIRPRNPACSSLTGIDRLQIL